MQTLLTVLHISSCVLLVLVVLIQSGRGAEMSASFAGSSQSVFGSSGGANFFTKFTAVLAAIFMATAVALTVHHSSGKGSTMDKLQTQPAGQTAPATAPTTPDAAAPAPATAPAPAAPATTPSK
jgi:preprotein translocase subunit SecG